MEQYNGAIRVFVEKSCLDMFSFPEGVQVIPVEITNIKSLELKKNDWVIVPNSQPHITLKGGRRYSNSNFRMSGDVSKVFSISNPNIVVLDPNQINNSGCKQINSWILKSRHNTYIPPKKKKVVNSNSNGNYRYRKNEGYFSTSW